ncbi:MAG: hypothetical protein P1V97_34625, partial [Planctomycetota bacterium]|nr:hypothetical protein [Planctomycetota bacterium]
FSQTVSWEGRDLHLNTLYSRHKRVQNLITFIHSFTAATKAQSQILVFTNAGIKYRDELVLNWLKRQEDKSIHPLLAYWAPQFASEAAVHQSLERLINAACISILKSNISITQKGQVIEIGEE